VTQIEEQSSTEHGPRDLVDLDLGSGIDPVDLFDGWFKAALESGNPEPTAMTLATVDDLGRPTARIVLLKGFDQRGLRFFTNYESRKAREIEGSPYVSLVFLWKELNFQIRVRGRATRLAAEESDEYFSTRPRGSQIGAWASDQSRETGGRPELVERLQATEERFADADVPRPEHWGGYVVDPDEFEFWQEGEFRLHDRIRFDRQDDGWSAKRLYP